MFYTERTYHITAQKERDVTMIYPSGLITAKVTNPDSWGTEPGPVTLPRLLRYTKHYYIGTERISSVTDTKSNLGHFIENLSYNDFFPVSTLRAMSNAQVEAAGEALEETYDHFGLQYTVPAPVVEGSKPTPGYTDFNNASIGRYFFHPDHLGSSSYITDKAGVVSQHMEYLPFGELLVDEHLNSHNSPFKFNAKELDPETGNYYYGARYYSQKYNLMLSVDPMYELYPSFSPYAYTLQNPVRYTDPTGMVVETYEVDKDGRICKADDETYFDKDGNEVDRIYVVNENFERTNKYTEVKLGIMETLTDLKTTITENGKDKEVEGQGIDFKNQIVQAEKVFEFLANNTNVEYGLIRSSDPRNISKTKLELFTSHEKGKEYFSGNAAIYYAIRGRLVRHDHNHPWGDSNLPSDADMLFKNKTMNIIKNLQNSFPNEKIKTPEFNIYHQYKYNPY